MISTCSMAPVLSVAILITNILFPGTTHRVGELNITHTEIQVQTYIQTKIPFPNSVKGKGVECFNSNIETMEVGTKRKTYII